MDDYIELGAGWFLYSQESPQLTSILDAGSAHPDRYFGFAAWKGRKGPVAGATLLEAQPTAKGNWEQTGPKEWKWIMPNGEKLDHAPTSWPRRIGLKNGASESLLIGLAGRIVANEAELIHLLRSVTKQLPQREVASYSAETRRETMRFLVPQSFDDPDSSQTHTIN